LGRWPRRGLLAEEVPGSDDAEAPLARAHPFDQTYATLLEKVGLDRRRVLLENHLSGREPSAEAAQETRLFVLA
jgi:hypothetical protein